MVEDKITSYFYFLMKQFAVCLVLLTAMRCTDKEEEIPIQRSVRYTIDCGSCFVQYEVNGVFQEKHFATRTWTYTFTGNKGDEVHLMATNENLNGGDISVSIFVNEALFKTKTSHKTIFIDPISQPSYAYYRTSCMVYGLIP
jgi:hypothetical protein